MYPTVRAVPVVRRTVAKFWGLDATPACQEDGFFAMENLSGRRYPNLATRAKRRTLAQLAAPQGLFSHGALLYADSGTLYYNGASVGTVSDGEKTFVGMGAYIVIFPDKLLFDTTTLALTSLEAHFTCTGRVEYTLARDDGSAFTDYAVQSAAPEDPADNALWLDTSVRPHTFKQFSAASGVWVPLASTYIRIASPGIGQNFARGDGVTISGSILDACSGTFTLVDCADDMLLITGLLEETASQEGGVSVSRTVPDMDFVCESDNRLWGCSSAAHEIYASKLGDPRNWRVYEGLSTDSYAVTVGSPGPFTGACAFGGSVFFFKEDTLHRLWGTKPANFQLSDTPGRGVEEGSEKSLCLVGGALYYKARGGVCVYAGGLPEEIGEPLGDIPYTRGVAGACGKNYYLCLRDASDTPHLFVFDTQRGVWYREDSFDALCMTSFDGALYAIGNGALVSLSGGTEGEEEKEFSWYAETPMIGVQEEGQRWVRRLEARLFLDDGASAAVDVKTDTSPEWEEVFSVRAPKHRSLDIPVRPRRCDHFAVRIRGTGEARLLSLTRVLEKGSEV